MIAVGLLYSLELLWIYAPFVKARDFRNVYMGVIENPLPLKWLNVHATIDRCCATEISQTTSTLRLPLRHINMGPILQWSLAFFSTVIQSLAVLLARGVNISSRLACILRSFPALTHDEVLKLLCVHLSRASIHSRYPPRPLIRVFTRPRWPHRS